MGQEEPFLNAKLSDRKGWIPDLRRDPFRRQGCTDSGHWGAGYQAARFDLSWTFGPVYEFEAPDTLDV
jgi:hypothetical protein